MSRHFVWRPVIHPIMGILLKSAACKSLWIDWWWLMTIPQHGQLIIIHASFGFSYATICHTSLRAQRKPMSLWCGNYFLPMATQNGWHLRTTHRLLLLHGTSLHLPAQLHNSLSATFLWIRDAKWCKMYKRKVDHLELPTHLLHSGWSLTRESFDAFKAACSAWLRLWHWLPLQVIQAAAAAAAAASRFLSAAVSLGPQTVAAWNAYGTHYRKNKLQQPPKDRHVIKIIK